MPQPQGTIGVWPVPCEPVNIGFTGLDIEQKGDMRGKILTSPWQALRAAVPIVVPCCRTVPLRWQGEPEEVTILTWERFPYRLSTM